jgi:uncharacterized protein (DUF1330 family)
LSAYFVIHNRVQDGKKMQKYVSKALKKMEPYKHEVLILDENLVEVETNLPRTIVIKFDSREAAKLETLPFTIGFAL